MDNNEEVVIYPKLGKLLFFSVIFVILGAVFLYLGLLSNEEISMIMAVVGLICVVLFGFCLFYFASRMINKQPSLIVNDVGITDQSSYIQAGTISWEEIKDIELYSMMNQRMIGIKLHNPEKFMSKQTGFKKMLMRANQGMVDTPINIAEAGLPMSLEELYLIIIQKWKLASREGTVNDL